MTDRTIPRYDEYFNADGSRKPHVQPKRTVRQQAGRLVRDLPDALGALDAFPAGRAVSMPLRGLARVAPRMMAVGAPPGAVRASARPVMRETPSPGAYAPNSATGDTYSALAAGAQTLPLVGRVVATRRYRHDREEK